MEGESQSNATDSATDLVWKGHPCVYHCPHDTEEYARSLEKYYVMNGSSPPALVLAMTIGVAGFDHVLTSPPFSNLTTKAMQDGYIPINSHLSKEVLRRSHFLLQEIDNTKTEHPLRDNSMRLRMPQPSQWTRDKRIKFLEEKNMLELSQLDLEFLRGQVLAISEEVEAKLATIGKTSRKRGQKELLRTGAFLSDESADVKAVGRNAAGLSDGDDGSPDQKADVDGFAQAKGAARTRSLIPGRATLQGSKDESQDSDSSNLLYDNVATRLYGVANGSTVLHGVSEETATATLEYLLNNRLEALRFLKVGKEFYEASGSVAPDEKIEKCIGDLIKFYQRKRMKVEATVV